MLATIQYHSRKLKIDFSQPLDISIPLRASKTNVNAWYLEEPRIEPVREGEWVAAVREGASINFNTIQFKQIQFALGNKKRDAVVLRTIPNTKEKLTRQYSHTNWPYLTEEAVNYLVKKGIKHLLIDQPSVDKEKDEGKLLAHHAFWNTKGKLRLDATITEFIYVPNSIKDGTYFLNLQIAPFENDASPSKPVLYKIEDLWKQH